MTTLVVDRRSAVPDVEPAKIKPVKWWAAGGVVVLGLIAISVGRWLLGGHAKPTSVGSSDVPTFMLVSIRIHEIVFPAIAVFTVYWTLVRPWRRERRLTADGILCLSLWSVWWFTDPMANYHRIMYVYNSAAVNLGCPQCFLPGWQSRATSYAEPIVWGQAFYIGCFVLLTMVGCRLLGWYRQRWPHHGRLAAVFFVLVVATLFDLLCEIYWMKLGLYNYPNLPLALFSDHYYRIPLHEIPFTGLWYTGIVCCRYFVNDKGETWAERGVSDLRISSRRKTALRVLASVAMYNVSIMVTYMIPMGLHEATTSTAWPKDIVSRTYFSQQICGPDTTYACMDPRVPLPVDRRSAHIAPDGRLVVPDGLPDQTEVK